MITLEGFFCFFSYFVNIKMEKDRLVCTEFVFFLWKMEETAEIGMSSGVFGTNFLKNCVAIFQP